LRNLIAVMMRAPIWIACAIDRQHHSGAATPANVEAFR